MRPLALAAAAAWAAVAKSKQPSFMEVNETALQIADGVQDRPAWMDFRTAVRRVLGTSEWRSDEDRVNAAEAKRQRKQKRNIQHSR